MNQPQLWTPRDARTDVRHRLMAAERLQFPPGESGRGGEWIALVKDTEGRHWLAWDADCGSEGCHCDAIAVQIPPALARQMAEALK